MRTAEAKMWIEALATLKSVDSVLLDRHRVFSLWNLWGFWPGPQTVMW